jgi:beta-glucanase (GH16 family)
VSGGNPSVWCTEPPDARDPHALDLMAVRCESNSALARTSRKRRRRGVALMVAVAVAMGVTVVLTALVIADPAGLSQGGPDPQPIEGTAPSSRPPAAPASELKLVWSDEFNARAGTLPKRANWSFQQGGKWGEGRELQCYTKRASNAAHDGRGNLVITARKERYACFDNPYNRYTSARIRSKGKREFQFGYIEARIKIPTGKGIWPAFWTLGNIGVWPEEGEVGIMETIGSRPTTHYHTLHGATQAGAHWQLRHANTGPVWSKRFHTYGMLWEAGKFTFYVDGRATWVQRTSDLPSGAAWPFDSFPHYLIFNVAVGGSWPGSPSKKTRFPQAMRIDYVRVYQ